MEMGKSALTLVLQTVSPTNISSASARDPVRRGEIAATHCFQEDALARNFLYFFFLLSQILNTFLIELPELLLFNNLSSFRIKFKIGRLQLNLIVWVLVTDILGV